VIPNAYKEVYQFNPLAALVLALRQVLLHDTAPSTSLLIKFAVSSFLMLAIGLFVFRRSKAAFYDYL